MKEQARKLSLLGTCDYELSKLRVALDDKPEKVVEGERKLELEKNYFDSVCQRKEILEKKVAEHERFIELEKEKIAILQKQLLEPKGQKVFQKIKEAAATAERFIKKSETQMVFLLEKIEKLDFDRLKSEESMESIQSDMAEDCELFEGYAAEIRQRIETLENQREELTGQIKGKLLWKYGKLLERGVIPPVATVSTNVCNRCSINFPPQVYQLLLTTHVGECPNCLRILVEATTDESDIGEPSPSSTTGFD